ncbi:MAG: hypothetical protein HW390_1269 [Candidatus Brocadiaceae bacterium]|nr:hypothetical protein [Candidatus Brocadiaceae bacterium]
MPNTQPHSFLKAYIRSLLRSFYDVSIPLLQTDRPSGAIFIHIRWHLHRCKPRACTLVYTAYPGCAAPTGLKQQVSLFTHRSRSGLLLLHPDGVSLSYPVRGNTIVAHCVSGGKTIARRYQAPEGRHKPQNIQIFFCTTTPKIVVKDLI